MSGSAGRLRPVVVGLVACGLVFAAGLASGPAATVGGTVQAAAGGPQTDVVAPGGPTTGGGPLGESATQGGPPGASPAGGSLPGGPGDGGTAPPAAQLADDLFTEPSDTVAEPELDVFLEDPVVEPGTETTVDLTVLNTGNIEAGSTLDEETATARGVSLTVDDDDAPVEVENTEIAVGSVPPGEAVSVPLTITAPASADGDDGELEIDVEYTYTEYDEGGDADDETDTDSFDVEIEVSSRSQFEIAEAETDTQIGTDGTVEVELENVGDADAEAVRVSARSPTSGVTVGTGADNGGEGRVAGPGTGPDTTDTRTDDNGVTDDTSDRSNGNGVTASSTDGSAAFLGDLDEDDSETVSFDTRIDPEVSVESYLLELTVVYEDEDGVLRESPTLATAVEPTAEQSFEIDAVESSLEVGDSGTITAEIENTGPSAVETPVVRAEPASDRIDIGESQVAVADLNDSESAAVGFDAEVSGQANPGRRQVTFTVEYGLDGERLESDPFVRGVTVGAEQPAFDVTAEDGEIPAGTTRTVELNVTNNRAETLSNINVFLYPDGPLSVDSDEAFVPELEPDESRTVAVEVSVDESANPRAYPLEADFRYDGEDDEDLISQVYQIPITVTEPTDDDGLLPSLVSLAGVAVLLVGGAVLVQRRR